ncbi:hypothetical protein GCM10027404_05050 [Arthrobacter tumbae]|uniref:hypothetical protein n=1 Tax=Arthrobacter tumbae TaxID=163874 RepID=UPI001955F9FB|nr:hypothetical protein [Arthrobacter tumbae]MBM7780052.1 hypothetical protein [Arthrobacter tumbae]
MTAGQWRVTALLVVLALASALFLRLDPAHAVVLVTAAFTAGVVNGILDNLDADRLPALSTPPRSRGLAEVQALEFSLSGSQSGVGIRAVNQLADLAAAALESRRINPLTIEGPLATLLAARRGIDPSAVVDAGVFDAAMDQLEQLVRAEPDVLPGHRRLSPPPKDSQ